MSDLKWRAAYSGETVEQLIALESTYRIDSLVLAFEQALDQKAARRGPQSLTKEEQVILAVEALEREVNNGGYAQFFTNSSREYTPIIVDALLRIDCPEVAELTSTAIAALEIPQLSPELVAAEMRRVRVQRDEALHRIDEQYFEHAGMIADQLFDFIKANRNAMSL